MSTSAEVPTVPAPIARRAAARVLDTFVSLSLLLLAYTIGARLALRATDANAGELGAEATSRLVGGLVIGVVLVVVAEVLPTAYAGATLGKRVLGIRVQRVTDGGRIGLGRALARWLPPSLGGLVCGLGAVVYLSALLDSTPQRQGWHDMLARSVVVVRPPKVRDRRKSLPVSPGRPTR